MTVCRSSRYRGPSRQAALVRCICEYQQAGASTTIDGGDDMRAAIGLALMIGWSLSAHAGPVGHIRLRSSPPGARITVDGTPVGVTPLDWDVTAGKHMIGMECDHHQPQNRTITVSADHAEVVDMSLVETTTNAVRRERADSLRSRVLPIAAMGAGAAAVIVGGVLIAVDQNPGPRAPPSVHNSAPFGAGVSIAGAAAAGVGAYLWFRAAEPTSSPVAVVTGDTAYLGWLGRF